MWAFNEISGKQIFSCKNKIFLGVKHGYTGKGLDFGRVGFDKNSDFLCETFKKDKIQVLTQVHGQQVIDFRFNNIVGIEDQKQGDSLIVDRFTQQNAVYGIRTADCVPILLITDTEVALIHAGWRGLSCGIIDATLSKLSSPIYAAIFPAADFCCYETSLDFKDYFNESRYRDCFKGGKELIPLYFSPSRAAKVILEGNNKVIDIFRADICTICDTRFHSFRREGEAAGRNLLYFYS